MLIDSYQRQITCLRISVTDQCNLRCVYCGGGKPSTASGNHSLLSPSEIRSVVEAAAEKGIGTIRITGGEPLLRHDLDKIIGEISEVQGIEDIGITTNGFLLEKLAPRLMQAGLKRVNVSLDTLQESRFRVITGSSSFNRIWNGILAAEMAGIKPIKINCVIMRGVNDDELAEIASLTIERPWHVRFIELMPLVDDLGMRIMSTDKPPSYMSIAEMIDRLQILNIIPADKVPGTCPVVTYKIPGAKGTIGFIAPLGRKFCATCNRLRLTSDGFLRTCLLDDNELSIRDSIHSKEQIIGRLELAASLKPESHHMEDGYHPARRQMGQIGG